MIRGLVFKWNAGILPAKLVEENKLCGLEARAPSRLDFNRRGRSPLHQESPGFFADGTLNLSSKRQGSNRDLAFHLNLIRFHSNQAGNLKPHDGHFKYADVFCPIFLHIADPVSELRFDLCHEALYALNRFRLTQAMRHRDFDAGHEMLPDLFELTLLFLLRARHGAVFAGLLDAPLQCFHQIHDFRFCSRFHDC